MADFYVMTKNAKGDLYFQMNGMVAVVRGKMVETEGISVEELTSVVCKEMAKWMHNVGGRNDYISWID